ncbi:AAA family ATPase [Lentzea alba]|uniref:AfsR/SARP family transcriptional regulator n=1 Tax=Lentzea alba TaxID=2714351 RepID=UPI0039BF250A
MIEFRVLGGVEAYAGDHQVNIGPAKQRCVLAVLLAEANRPVSADQLIDRVWADSPPLRVRASLHTYLARLRAAGVRITGRRGSYLFAADERLIDLHRFRLLVRQAKATSDDRAALEVFEQALSLWRGELFAGHDTPWLADARTSAELELWEARLDHVDVALRCGRHAALVPELSTVAGRHPLDERVAGQLMTALYRNGRQAGALEVYQRIRRRLADELGADPGPALRRLHHQILTADPALTTGAAGRPWRTQCQLVLDVADFVGRDELVDRLTEFLRRPGGVMIAAITGAPGVGKTTVAVRVAHRLRSAFPDGQWFIGLGGSRAPLDVLGDLLEAAGVEDVPPSLDARAAVLRATLADRQVLLVVDDARDADHVRPLLPGTAGCAVLVTSRNDMSELTALQGGLCFRVDALDAAEARTLLARVLGPAAVLAEPRAADELAAQCGHLPRKIRLAATRLHAGGGSIADYVALTSCSAFP